MKITFSVKACQSRSHNLEVTLPGYYASEEVIQDLTKMVDFHKLKYDKWKREYIANWGEEQFNKAFGNDL